MQLHIFTVNFRLQRFVLHFTKPLYDFISIKGNFNALSAAFVFGVQRIFKLKLGTF